MNRFPLPSDFEDALLKRAEHHEVMGQTAEALHNRRFVRQLRRIRSGHPRVSGPKNTVP